VLLELALVRWALERLRAQGFEPVIPPVLVREQALYGTGFLPDTEQQIYRLPEDELYLVGTSEVALASLHAGEILDAEALPLRYAGFSSCFRREAGAAGKDTRGIFRVHQFDKVEMFVFTTAEEAAPSTSGSSRSRSRSCASSRSPTASSTSRSATSAPRRRRSTTARPGCRARAATAS
jgi:seryl-tRNA synthetase